MPSFLLTTRSCLAILLILSPCLSIRAQDEGNTLQRLQNQIERLNVVLEKQAKREKTLVGRVNNLEKSLREEREQTHRQLDALKSESFSRQIEAAIGESEHLLTNLTESPGSNPGISLGGYFDLEYRDEQVRANNTFDQHRLIIQIGATILEDAITFKSEIEIEGGGADASFLTGNEVVVEFGEIHLHMDRTFNLKAGALLVPFGRFNTLHDSPLRDLTDRPLVHRRIIPTTWTDAGVGIYGAFDLNDTILEYDVILSNGLDDDFSTTPGGGFRGNRNSFRSDNNSNKMLIGRVGLIPNIEFLDTTELGVSFGIGKYDDDDDHQMSMLGLDWRLGGGPFEFIGEYACYDLDRGQDEIDAGAPGGASGFYAQVNYHFFPESWRGATKLFTDESTFTLVFRYGTIDTDDSTTGIDRVDRGDGFRDDLVRYTLGINFRPIEKTVFKIEYQFIEETDNIPEADNNRFVISFATFF